MEIYQSSGLVEEIMREISSLGASESRVQELEENSFTDEIFNELERLSILGSEPGFKTVEHINRKYSGI